MREIDEGGRLSCRLFVSDTVTGEEVREIALLVAGSFQALLLGVTEQALLVDRWLLWDTASTILPSERSTCKK